MNENISAHGRLELFPFRFIFFFFLKAPPSLSQWRMGVCCGPPLQAKPVSPSHSCCNFPILLLPATFEGAVCIFFLRLLHRVTLLEAGEAAVLDKQKNGFWRRSGLEWFSTLQAVLVLLSSNYYRLFAFPPGLTDATCAKPVSEARTCHVTFEAAVTWRPVIRKKKKIAYCATVFAA